MKTLIAVPCMDTIYTRFFTSYAGLKLDGYTKLLCVESSLIYDARNSLARQAICEGFDRVLWLDSDMVFKPDLYLQLKADLDEGRDIVSGLYVTRKGEIKPVLYSECRYEHVTENEVKPIAKTYYDYPKESIFEVDSFGFGGVLMNVSLLEKIEQKFGLPFAPMLGFGEDLAFCMRAKAVGAKLWCDSRVKLGHIGLHTFTEDDLCSKQ